MKNILVFGASGRVGRPLIQLLHDQPGIQVIAALRNEAAALKFQSPGIKTILVDLDEYETAASLKYSTINLYKSSSAFHGSLVACTCNLTKTYHYELICKTSRFPLFEADDHSLF